MYTSSSSITAQNTLVKSFLGRTFSWMSAGLLLSAAVAFITAHSPNLETAVAQGLWLLILLELGAVLGLTLALPRLSAATAGLLFIAYAALNGLTLSGIFLAYSGSSIWGTFITTALMFGAMAVWGYTTRADLTRFGSLLFMGLIGVILALVVNLFLNNGALGLVVNILGALIFTGLTAWDVQKLKRMALFGMQGLAGNRGQGFGSGNSFSGSAWGGAVVQSDVSEKMAIFGALMLYLDFINRFLFLLRIFGGGRR